MKALTSLIRNDKYNYERKQTQKQAISRYTNKCIIYIR